MFMIVGMLFAASVNAATQVSGTLYDDDDAYYHTLNVGADDTGTYTFESFGYAGGTMLDGTVVVDGGFDSWLHIFNPITNQILSQDDGASRVSASSGSSFDFLADIYLGVGQYFVVVTQYANSWDGSVWSGAGTTGFEDVTGSTRTNEFAFEYSVSQVPVPAALFLFAPALLGFFGLRRKAAVAA